MEIPRAIDPTERVVLEVQPAAALLALIAACEESLRFQERQKSRQWNARSSQIYFRLMPPEELTSEFDYLAFEMAQADDGSVEGELIFNLQEKSMVDYFKAIIGKDKIRRPFRLASSQLYFQDGRVNSTALAVFIGGLLKEVIDQRKQ